MRKRTGAVVLGVALLMACGTDPTEEMVRDALTASGIENVDVRADRNAIRLTGTVETLADRTRAVELAAAIVGPSTPVVNDITVGGLGPLQDGRAESSAGGAEQ